MATATLTKGVGYWIQESNSKNNGGSASGDWTWYIGIHNGSYGTAADVAYAAACVGFSVPELVMSSGTVKITFVFSHNWNDSGPLNAVLSTTAPTADTSWRFGPTSGVISNVQTFNSGTINFNFTLNDGVQIGGKTIYLYLYATKGRNFGVVTGVCNNGTLEYVEGGLAYINNGTSWDKYEVHISNGSGWDKYIPYIYNGSGWDIMG